MGKLKIYEIEAVVQTIVDQLKKEQPTISNEEIENLMCKECEKYRKIKSLEKQITKLTNEIKKEHNLSSPNKYAIDVFLRSYYRRVLQKEKGILQIDPKKIKNLVILNNNGDLNTVYEQVLNQVRNTGK